MFSVADEIEKLHGMYEKDILTKEEFQEAKAAVLAKHKAEAVSASTASSATPPAPPNSGSSTNALQRTCGFPGCGTKEPAPEAFQRCSRCKETPYCGSICQKKHWKEHKVDCIPIGIFPSSSLEAEDSQAASSPFLKLLDEANGHRQRGPSLAARAKAALKCYNEAVGIAATPTEKSRALNHAARAAWVVTRAEPPAVRLLHFKECIDHCNAALSLVTTGEGNPLAEAGKDDVWFESLCVFTHTVLTETLCGGEWGSRYSRGTTPLDMLEQEVHKLRNCVTFRLSVGITLLAKVHKMAVLAKEEGEFKKVFEFVSHHQALADNLEEMLQRSRRVLPIKLADLRTEEVTDLLDSWRHTQDDALATKALRGAHALMADAKDEVEFETMAYKSLMAIDSYHQVASYKRSASEAEAEACIGMLQQDVFKSVDNAARHYSTAVHVAMSCAPVSFEGVPWFQRANRELAKRQEERQLEEAKAKDKERAPYLEMLKADLEALKGAQDKGAYELLKLLYQKYEAEFGDKHVAEDKLPKRPGRKDVMQACLPFHPDKHADKERKTQILYEEITKALTAELNALKQ